MTEPIIFTAEALAVANLVMSFAIVRSRAFEPIQKLFQCALVWLVPIVGAAVCLYFLREEARAAVSPKAGGSLTTPGYDNYPESGHDGGHHSGH